jgi:hypothetical protein
MRISGPQAGELRVGVAEPAGRRRVGGRAVAQEPVLTLGAAGLGAPQDLERLLARERVAQVPEVLRVVHEPPLDLTEVVHRQAHAQRL